MRITFRPLLAWPGASTHPHDRRGPRTFKASWPQTLDELERELTYIAAEDVVLQVAVAGERDITRDGFVRADARVTQPGVILSFTHPLVGPVQYPCDRYDLWQHNVRGIVLSLESLRAVDRHGVTRSAEQYRGWKALPATTGPTMTVETAAVVLSNYSSILVAAEVVRSRESARAALRAARSKEHPDVGGDPSRWHNVELAREVLEAHHGGTL